MIRRGSLVLQTVPTESDAGAAARALARESRPSQLVIHDQAGRIQADHVYGMPKIQTLPYRSKLGRRRIERAVSKVADARG